MDTHKSSVPEPAIFRSRDGIRSTGTAAFSLVEVTLAVGIMGFAFIAILGLVPLGLTTFRDAKNAAVGAQISQQIVAEIQVASFDKLTNTTSNLNPATVTNSQGLSSQVVRLPAPAEPTVPARFFTDQGTEVPSTDPSGIYQVNVRVLIGPAFIQPAGTTGGVANADVAGVTIQVAFNPGRLPLDLDSANADLWKGTSGSTTVPISTFDTCVARNF